MKLLFVFIPLLATFVFGNGGGYNLGSKFSGTIAPFSSEGTEIVSIEDETLEITMLPDYARVRVRYVMKNTSEKSVNVKFGFPVEDVEDHWLGGDHQKKADVIEYCKNYKVQLRGADLKHTYEAEPYAKGLVKPFEGSKVLEGIKGWMVSKMRLKKNELVVLEITYDSEYAAAHYFVSDDSSQGPWLFKYRLSTAGVWNGPIKKGRVVVRNQGLDSKQLEVVSPANRFKREGDSFIWNFENLEPSLGDDITVKARSAVASYYRDYGEYDETTGKQTHGRYFKIDGKFYLGTANYEVVASSVLKPSSQFDYVANNVNPSVYNEKGYAWSEGAEGDGIGETLTITLNKPLRMQYLLFYNGYGKNSAVFDSNNRVKQISYQVNEAEKGTFALYDHYHAQLVEIKNTAKAVKTIKLSIDAVYPGSRYQDTCLSGVYLLQKLKNEPKRYGAR